MSNKSRVIVYSDQLTSPISSDYSFESFSHRLLRTYKTKQIESTQIDQIESQLKTNLKWNPISFQEEFVDSLPTDRILYHDGYIEYLIAALRHGYGIEVAPWFIWNIILREIWEMINTDPDRYRELFSRNCGVIQLVQKGDFKIESYMEKLRDLVPLNLSKLYPPLIDAPANWLNSMYGLFNVTTEKSEIQFQSLHVLNKIRIIGSHENWYNLTRALTNLIENLQELDPINDFNPYLMQCLHKLKNIETHFNSRSYWKDFASIDEKGLQGHILAFIPSRHPKKMISKFPYANNRGEQYYFISGIMCSQVDYNQILIPEYHCLTAKLINTQQSLSVDEKAQLEVQLRYLRTIQKYDLRNVYKSHQYEIYNETKRKLEWVSIPDCQCEWFRENEKPTNTYLSGTLEESLYRDHFRMTDQLINERSDPHDMKFLTDHIDTIYDFIVKDSPLHESVIHAFISTFDIKVIEALLSTHLKHNQNTSDTLGPKLITSIIQYINRMIYVEKSLRQSLIQSLLESFRLHSQQIVSLIESKLQQSVSYDLADQIKLAHLVTDHYQLPAINLHTMITN